MKDNILEKLRKLIAHEKSARTIGNIHEAEAFAAKIQDLLTSHKLGMDEVEYSEREASEPVDFERVHEREAGTTFRASWLIELAKAIAEVNGCDFVRAGGSRGTAFNFCGRTSDRQVAKVLFLYLAQLGEELCAKCSKEDEGEQKFKFTDTKHIDGTTPQWFHAAFKSWMQKYRNGWKEGFSTAVCQRLRGNYAKAVKTATSMSIVWINKDALAVKKFVDDNCTTVRSGSWQKDGSQDGFKRGKALGSAINLTPHNVSAKVNRVAGYLAGA